MAAPSVTAISTASDNASTNSSLTIPLPSGSAAGLVVLVSASVRNSTAVLSLSGATQVQQDNGTGALGTWIKVLTSGDVTAGSVTVTSTGAGRWAGGIALLSSDAATSVDVSSTNKSTTSTTSWVATGVTTTGPDRRLLAFFSSINSTGNLGLASGMTLEWWEVKPSSSSTSPVHVADEGVQSTAGATGDKTATNTVSAGFIAHLVAVGPGAARSLVPDNRLVRRNSLLRR